MSNKDPKQDIVEVEKNKKAFGKIVRISLILGIIAVSGVIVYYLLNPEPGYIDFGILNSNKKAEDYPTEVAANESVDFYVTVGNYLNREFKFCVKVLKGDNETEIKDSGSEGAHLNFTTKEKTLKSGENWMSEELSFSFEKAGQGQVLIVELWEITKDEKEFYNILYLRLEVTS